MSDFENTPNEPEENLIHERAGAPESAGASGPWGGDLASETWDSTAPSGESPHLFHTSFQPEAVAPPRIPHFGHLCLLAGFVAAGFFCATVLMMIALHFHLFGVATVIKAATDVHYILGFEAILYLVAFSFGLLLFPLLWRKSFFAGVQWRGAAALDLGWKLPAIALGCFGLAALDQTLLPGPANAPIEDIFRSPGAAWLMFGFGVAFAPFFEEMAFRGFLLPAVATAWDWAIEKSTGKPARPLDANGHPQWSIFAMVVASVATSLPFALVHAAQQGHSLGPFILLITISLILCAVRIVTRSLAASTLVHASYNFLLFFLMLVSTGGFRHLDKL
jgi:membrane protease YdiL (CAAX protease family)